MWHSSTWSTFIWNPKGKDKLWHNWYIKLQKMLFSIQNAFFSPRRTSRTVTDTVPSDQRSDNIVLFFRRNSHVFILYRDWTFCVFIQGIIVSSCLGGQGSCHFNSSVLIIFVHCHCFVCFYTMCRFNSVILSFVSWMEFMVCSSFWEHDTMRFVLFGVFRQVTVQSCHYRATLGFNLWHLWSFPVPGVNTYLS